jgi:hypothetical protein
VEVDVKRPTREEVEEILKKAKLPLVVELAKAYLAALDVAEAARGVAQPGHPLALDKLIIRLDVLDEALRVNG